MDRAEWLKQREWIERSAVVGAAAGILFLTALLYPSAEHMYRDNLRESWSRSWARFFLPFLALPAELKVAVNTVVWLCLGLVIRLVAQ
ncbi:MAG: hypothetical protein FJ304_19910 [Planctomycetes bacterium]|nr:hypothetical protein [Planctomycetota bacterium]